MRCISHNIILLILILTISSVATAEDTTLKEYIKLVMKAQSKEGKTQRLPIVCRGGFLYKNFGSNLEIEPNLKSIWYARNETAAGIYGTTLKPGACAWRDSPIGRKEHLEIVYATQRVEIIKNDIKVIETATAPILAICAMNDDCIITLVVTKEKINNRNVLFGVNEIMVSKWSSSTPNYEKLP